MHIRRMELMGRENVTRANHQMNQVLDSNHISDKSSHVLKKLKTILTA